MRKRNLLKNVTGKKRNYGIKAFLMVVIFFLGTIGLTILTSASATTVSQVKYLDYHSIFEFQDSDTVKTKDTTINFKLDNLYKKRDNIRLQLIDEVHQYMMLANQGKSRMAADYIVDKCLETGYDIPLLLSQSLNETGFGTAGAGKSRNSCFGVVKKRYSSTENAIDDYINIMQKSYIPETRSLDNLFNSGFRSVKGYKYASDPGYSKKIKNTRNMILKGTKIQQYFNEYFSLSENIELIS